MPFKQELEKSLLEVEVKLKENVGKKVSFKSAEIHFEMIDNAKTMLTNLTVGNISKINDVIQRIKCLV